MEFQTVVDHRRMVRKYEVSKRVPVEMVEVILSNALRAPSAGFTQGWGFLVLDDPNDIVKFREAATPATEKDSWYAATFDAPLVIIPCSNQAAYFDRYAQPDKGMTDRSDAWWPAPYWDIDAGFASLLMLLTAVDRGLGARFLAFPRKRSCRWANLLYPSGVPPPWRDNRRLPGRAAPGPESTAQASRRRYPSGSLDRLRSSPAFVPGPCGLRFVYCDLSIAIMRRY